MGNERGHGIGGGRGLNRRGNLSGSAQVCQLPKVPEHSASPMTAALTRIQYGERERATVRHFDGTTSQISQDGLGAYVSEAENPSNSKDVDVVEIELPDLAEYPGLRFVDTPGMGSVYRYHKEVSENWLPEAGVVIPVISADRPLSEPELQLIEAAAEGADDLIETYFDAGTLTPDEIRRGLREGLQDNRVVPIFAGSSLLGSGISSLLTFIRNNFPSPVGKTDFIVTNGEKGEITIKGDNVMVGYWKNPKATEETIKNGWLHTGDMGFRDADGFLHVLGRFKSLLISNDGEKFSPEGIEEAMVDQSPFLDQVMLYNNQNPYTVGMVVPNMNAIKHELEKKGIKSGTSGFEEAVLKLVQQEVDAYKKGGKFDGMFPERWLPTAVALLPEAFTETNGLINSTMKMVRGKITKYFAKELEFLYKPEAKNIINPVNMEAVKKWEK